MIVVLVILIIFLIMSLLGMISKPRSVYKYEPSEKNSMEGKEVQFVTDESKPKNADGVRGYLIAIGNTDHKPSFYEKVVKRILDILLSFFGMIILSPVFLVLSLWIVISDPGPVFFTQKRVGKNKQFFLLHKFRSMKMSAPHDKPTHMLDNSERHITRVGKIIRKHSLDELPQIWDIFIGNMSVVGPRPGLWNQDWLTAERDKYGANDIKPGLTGWAQINGRDGLTIADKARLDGEYTKKLSFSFDVKCFFGTFGVFAGDKNVIEGGTGDRHD